MSASMPSPSHSASSQHTRELSRFTTDALSKHRFQVPIKRIDNGRDVSFFLSSYAYNDIMTFVLQLTTAMFPRRDPITGVVNTWTNFEPLMEDPTASDTVAEDSRSGKRPNNRHVVALRAMLATLDDMVAEHPPDPGPRRFGNMAFRSWFEAVEGRADALLDQYMGDVIALNGIVQETRHDGVPGFNSEPSARDELKAYLMGSWGSAQRLDYGTGHELSFLAFLGGLWKLGVFQDGELNGPIGDGEQERAIVLGVIEPYLALIRRLILTYTLEPAGSHGVWGLDDHSFLPYIIGSAQLSPAITSSKMSSLPTEGSLPDAPNPSDVTKPATIDRERKRNMYFGAIGFIYDVKKGPFWEHSPVLFDISGVEKGWAKICKGMIKMYNAEVLSKFPVVQHFPFGSLFKWEHDPAAIAPLTTPHVASHAPQRKSDGVPGDASVMAPWTVASDEMSARRGGGGAQMMPTTAAPWAKTSATAVPSRGNRQMLPPIAAARLSRQPPQASQQTSLPELTRAPWAK